MIPTAISFAIHGSKATTGAMYLINAMAASAMGAENPMVSPAHAERYPARGWNTRERKI